MNAKEKTVLFFIINTLSLIILFISRHNPSRIEKDTKYKKYSKKVFALYFGCWGTIENDKALVSWSYQIRSSSPERIVPPDIPSTLYPKLGIYSSHNESILRHHCSILSSIGIDAIFLYYFGTNHSDFFNDGFEKFSIQTLDLLLKIVPDYNIKVGIFIPFYNSQNYYSLESDINYFYQNYKENPSVFSIDNKPVILFSESNFINSFPTLISKFPNLFFINTITYSSDVGASMEEGYDGIFTLDASEGHIYASTISNWKLISSISAERNMFFIPTVSPGFNDTQTRRWSSPILQRSRENGEYYNRMWKAAIEANPPAVLINSFNNWLQGTMIEPAIEHGKFKYNKDIWSEYGDPMKYINLTKHWISKFKKLSI